MARNTKVLLVVNPISGGTDKTPLLTFIKEKIDQREGALSVYYTSGVDDRERLEQLYHKSQPQRVLVIGGDGTLKMVAEVLKNAAVPIGLFPAGSANGLAENLELPTDRDSLMEIALGSHQLDIDCIDINGELCLHISDIGLNAELIRNYEEGTIRGKLGYFLQSIPTLIQSNFPFPFTITIQGQNYTRNAVLIAVANAKKYGTGATINPHGRLDDGCFELLVFKKFNIPEILRTFQENARPREDFLEIFPAKEVRIESEKPLPFQVDGEYRGEVREVHAKLSPLKVRLAVPKGFSLT